MANLVRARGWGQVKPPPGAQIDWGHPLAQGLVFCALFNEQSGAPHDLVTGNVGTFGGTRPLWRPNISGVGLNGTGGAAYVSFPLNAALKVVQPFSIAHGMWSASNANTVVMEANGNSGFSVQEHPQGWALTTNGSQVFGPATLADSRFHVAVWTATSTTQRYLDIDGIRTAGTASASTPTYGAATTLDLFSRAGSFGFDQFLGFAHMWNRALTVDESQWLAREPYAFFAPPAPRIFYIAPLVVPPVIPVVDAARPGGTRYDQQTIDRLTREARLERARREDEELICLL